MVATLNLSRRWSLHCSCYSLNWNNEKKHSIARWKKEKVPCTPANCKFSFSVYNFYTAYSIFVAGWQKWSLQFKNLVHLSAGFCQSAETNTISRNYPLLSSDNWHKLESLRLKYPSEVCKTLHLLYKLCTHQHENPICQPMNVLIANSVAKHSCCIHADLSCISRTAEWVCHIWQ